MILADQHVLALGALALESEFGYNSGMKPSMPLHLDQPFHPLNPLSPTYVLKQHPAPSSQPSNVPVDNVAIAAACLVGAILLMYIISLFGKK